MVGFFRHEALPLADIATPNLFELGALTDRQPASEAETVAAARELVARGPALVLVTSVTFEPHPDEIVMLAVTAKGAWRVAAPFRRLGATVSGAGDLTAALFLGHSLSGAGPAEALGRTAWAVGQVIAATAEHWSASAKRPEDGELALIDARHALLGERGAKTPALEVSAIA